MAHIGATECCVSDPSDRYDESPTGQLAGKRNPSGNFGGGWRTIRTRVAGMGWHDVPEQHVICDAELGKDAMDDRGCCLGRPLARHLTLRRQRQTRDTGATVARRLGDQ